MRLLEKPRLLVLSPEEFEECRPYLRAAGYRWLPCGDGISESQLRQWWSPYRHRWVSDRDKSEDGTSQHFLELECLPHILSVTNARDFVAYIGEVTS